MTKLKRYEFTTAAKREMRARAGGRCEAVGPRWGHAPGVRCNADLEATGIQFDHWPRGAHDPHPETRTAANGVVCCPRCNQHANNKHDTPREAKMKAVSYEHALHAARMQRKAGADIADPRPPREKKLRPKMRGRAFAGGKQKIPSRPFPKRTTGA